ncbi:MAG: 23S rRNA (adenine(2503)-C(2))-methyltransferase RlmN [Lachnospiraceae bacterium]|nr:23S rRNA (adenine(2503)-C(2))-methyltransferase RlmN [Lachnospiraceae bacterium]
MKDILSLTGSELKETLINMGEKAFRAKQIFVWLHDRRVKSFDEMTDISKNLRERLKAEYYIGSCLAETTQKSKIDGTEKYLYRLSDDHLIEGVFMKYREWNTACISSQVGCAMGCKFCASTVDGCIRNMTAGEMVEEIYAMEEHTGEKVSHVVVMGSGEPLINYDELMRFINIITDEDGKNLSQRNITVSTCGIVPAIIRLSKEKLQINLAISLHAPNDEKRRLMMPIAEKYSISELMDAVKRYYEATHRRLTFEYALAEGQNDGEDDAKELGELLKGLNAVINLIPVNPVTESIFKRPGMDVCRSFKNKLENFGINVTIRRELGTDIDGACGQLRMQAYDKGKGHPDGRKYDKDLFID